MLLIASLAAAQSAIPDLAQLKVAAESGDAVAQYEYAQKINFSNGADSFAMCLKSAKQGYGPAEDRIGAEYAAKAQFAGKDRSVLERLAVRYTSRAAFKGIPSALARLGTFYEGGRGVPRDLGAAYGWLSLALREAGGPSQLSAGGYKIQLDQLIARISTSEITRGQHFLNAFRADGGNFVEIDMLVAQMRLSAFFVKDGAKGCLVNQTRISVGETKQLVVDGEKVDLTCLKIEGRVGEFSVGQHRFTLAGR